MTRYMKSFLIRIHISAFLETDRHTKNWEKEKGWCGINYNKREKNILSMYMKLNILKFNKKNYKYLRLVNI